jgi:hypothetical protein
MDIEIFMIFFRAAAWHAKTVASLHPSRVKSPLCVNVLR